MTLLYAARIEDGLNRRAGLIAEDGARDERSRLQQCQLDVGRLEQTRPVPNDNRKHVQPVLVDHPRGDQRVDELRAARRDDVAARRLLQRAPDEQRVGGLWMLGVRRGDIGLVDLLVERIEPPLRHVDFSMELGGLEPPASWVRSRRSPN